MTNAQFTDYLLRHKGGKILGQYTGLSESTILRLLVRGEAEGEDNLGQIAVARTVINRVRSDKWWGTTVCQVSFWPHQFSCFWTDFNLRRGAIDAERRSPTARIVKNIVAAETTDPVKGAVYYWNPDVVKPSWASRVTIVKQIGHHVFAVDRPPRPPVIAKQETVQLMATLPEVLPRCDLSDS
jgi:spore germination cell wall hydrolase CwlJ-like protein